jgi:hypothetical protein
LKAMEKQLQATLEDSQLNIQVRESSPASRSNQYCNVAVRLRHRSIINYALLSRTAKAISLGYPFRLQCVSQMS